MAFPNKTADTVRIETTANQTTEDQFRAGMRTIIEKADDSVTGLTISTSEGSVTATRNPDDTLSANIDGILPPSQDSRFTRLLAGLGDGETIVGDGEGDFETQRLPTELEINFPQASGPNPIISTSRTFGVDIPRFEQVPSMDPTWTLQAQPGGNVPIATASNNSPDVRMNLHALQMPQNYLSSIIGRTAQTTITLGVPFTSLAPTSGAAGPGTLDRSNTPLWRLTREIWIISESDLPSDITFTGGRQYFVRDSEGNQAVSPAMFVRGIGLTSIRYVSGVPNDELNFTGTWPFSDDGPSSTDAREGQYTWANDYLRSISPDPANLFPLIITSGNFAGTLNFRGIGEANRETIPSPTLFMLSLSDNRFTNLAQGNERDTPYHFVFIDWLNREIRAYNFFKYGQNASPLSWNARSGEDLNSYSETPEAQGGLRAFRALADGTATTLLGAAAAAGINLEDYRIDRRTDVNPGAGSPPGQTYPVRQVFQDAGINNRNGVLRDTTGNYIVWYSPESPPIIREIPGSAIPGNTIDVTFNPAPLVAQAFTDPNLPVIRDNQAAMLAPTAPMAQRGNAIRLLEDYQNLQDTGGNTYNLAAGFRVWDDILGRWF